MLAPVCQSLTLPALILTDCKRLPVRATGHCNHSVKLRAMFVCRHAEDQADHTIDPILVEPATTSLQACINPQCIPSIKLHARPMMQEQSTASYAKKRQCDFLQQMHRGGGSRYDLKLSLRHGLAGLLMSHLSVCSVLTQLTLSGIQLACQGLGFRALLCQSGFQLFLEGNRKQ